MKSNLLAAALVLTVTPPWVQFGLPALEHCAFLVTQKLADFDDVCHKQLHNFSLIIWQTTLTAAHVARTLILASATGSVALKACTRILLPGTVDFVVRVVPSLRDASISEHHLAAIGEIWKAFVGFYTTSQEDIRTSFLIILGHLLTAQRCATTWHFAANYDSSPSVINWSFIVADCCSV